MSINNEPLPDDWDLEIQAFNYANDDTLPLEVRDFIKELWRQYCHYQIKSTSCDRE